MSRTKLVVFDLDDTLFDNHHFYSRANLEFAMKMLDIFGNRCADVEHTIATVTRTNAELMMHSPESEKFSRHRFPTSLMMVYTRFCKDFGVHENMGILQEVADIGMRVFDYQRWKKQGLVEGAQALLSYAREDGATLVLKTKGDTQVQSGKIVALDLTRYFDSNHIFIVTDKNVATFQSVLSPRYTTSITVGNASASDIKPALDAGFTHGIYVPYEMWSYEKSRQVVFENDARVKTVPSLVHALDAYKSL
ncbi:MAG TPA: HAD family hydrolase [Acidobacteriota bacterium]|nr:HAD family hydrolase [Acidobacteriota bacterium]